MKKESVEVYLRRKMDVISIALGKYYSHKCSLKMKQGDSLSAEDTAEMYVSKNMTMQEISSVTEMSIKEIRRKLRDRNVRITKINKRGSSNPTIGGRCLYQHLAEEKYDRSMKSNEVVHHLDLNHENNDPDNLVIVTRSLHGTLHWQLQYLAAELYRKGKIVFNEEKMRYELNDGSL